MAGSGVAVAASNGSAKAAHTKAGQVDRMGAAEQTAPDTDNIQSGDQTSPDPAASHANSDQGSQTGSESGSEGANNDGPGGHADEPANPNADHQFQGQE
jgi:hypothetical protein